MASRQVLVRRAIETPASQQQERVPEDAAGKVGPVLCEPCLFSECAREQQFPELPSPASPAMILVSSLLCRWLSLTGREEDSDHCACDGWCRGLLDRLTRCDTGV